MKKLRLLKGLFVAISLFCGVANSTSVAHAQEMAFYTNDDAIGILRGRVMDSEKSVMAGAAVYIKELSRGVAADADGFYAMQDVPAGTYTLEVSYVGYELTTQKVTISKKATTVADITIKDATTIDNVVVTSVMSGQARAMTSQKNALNMVDVISQDQTSKYPDANIGDALKRIAGINVQYDQGEARFGQVRGTPADMSSVTVNGGRIPSAEGETRSVQLDLIPTDMIQTIEVNKVVTADMEADAIGGSINLVTKNSPTQQIINAVVGTGYDMVSQRAQMNFGLTYGDKVSDKFGYIVSASYQNNPIGSDNTEFEWDTEDGVDYVKEMQIRQYYVQRERQSYSAAFNWNINDNNKIDFKGLYNRRNDWENRYRTVAKLNDDGSIKEASVETKGGSSDQKDGRLERQQTMDFTLGGEHLIGKLAIDWGATYSAASEDRPNERYISYAVEDTGVLNMDYSDKRQPYATNAADHLVLSNLIANGGELDELSQTQQEIQENNYGGQINFRYEIGNGNYSTVIKAGAKVTSKDKSVDVVMTEYKKTVDQDAFNAMALSSTEIMDRAGFMPGEKYNFGREFVTKDFIGAINFNDTSLYGAGKVDLSESAENYTANETVTAAYLRVDQRLGDKMTMVAGVRMENTSVSNNGFLYRDEDDETLDPSDEVNNNYTNVLPSILFKWDANKDLKVRASYTNTLARPKYSDLVNNIATDGTDEIEMGNPDLKASLAHNLDLSADYYFKSIGLIRGGIFYKKINDVIVDTHVEGDNGYTYAGTTYSEAIQPNNVGNADLLGFEVSFSRDFSFIAKSLSCLGFAGTYTYTHSEVSDFNIEGRENEKGLALAGSPKNTANASVYFQKWGLTARVSYNYASSFIDEYDKDAMDDIYYDSVDYLDLNLTYDFNRKWTIYADATNLLNQPLRYYQGTADRTYQAEYYGPRFNAGVKFNF